MLGLSLVLDPHGLFLTPSSQRQTAISLRNGPEPVPALACDHNVYCLSATKKSFQEAEETSMLTVALEKVITGTSHGSLQSVGICS